MRWLVVLLMLLLAGCNDKATVATAPTHTPSAAPVRETPTEVPPSSRPTTPAVRPSPTPRRTPSPTPAAARGYEVAAVTAADLPHSWHPGCPIGPSQLRMLTVPYLGFDGVRHQGRLVVRSSVAPALGRTFVRLYEDRFPIRSMRPVDDFGGDDDRSMAADNTSAFNCRAAVGGNGSWSQHAYGLAVDINTVENPYVYDGKVDPPAGRPYVHRSPARKGMILPGGPVLRAFGALGWGWGGNWSSSKDYQHFSSNGR